MLRLALLLFSALALAGPGDGKPLFYDEVFAPNGELRPQYEKIYGVFSKMTAADKKRFLKTSRAAFSGDNALDPLPRLITKSDYAVLERGVEQRANALRMFLQDHYSGKKSYLKIIPQETMDRIIARSGEAGFEGLVRPENIAFPYGPDIMRMSDGSWRVIEDNPGFIGGIGDLAKAQEILLNQRPEYKELLEIKNDPLEYYRTVVARARARAQPKSGKIVLYMVPPYPDKEDQRIRKLFHDEGVEILTPNTKNQLIVRNDGVFIKSADVIGKTPYERVGFVFINGEHKWIDATHPQTREMLALFEASAHLEEKGLNKASRLALEEAMKPNPVTRKIDYVALERALDESNFVNEIKDTVRSSVEGLTEAILKGHVATNYSPGVDFIGDKEFYTYVDDLVRHYSGQEPIIQNLPTTRFAKKGADGQLVLDEELLTDLFKDDKYKNYVIKVVDGRGGDGIYIGPKITKAEIPEIIARIKAHPTSYIAQPFSHLSVAGDCIVDIRMITDVGPANAYVSNTPWGRGIPIDGDGKVNLSKNGREFAVVIVDDPVAGVPILGRGGCVLDIVRRAALKH